MKRAKINFILFFTAAICCVLPSCSLFEEQVAIHINEYPPANRVMHNMAIFTVSFEIRNPEWKADVYSFDIELVPRNYSGNYVQYKASYVYRNNKEPLYLGVYPTDGAGNAIPATINNWQVIIRENTTYGDGRILTTYDFEYTVTWTDII